MGDLSEHFSLREFRDHSTGAVHVEPELIWRLEALRNIVKRPLVIVSGYRTAAHNRAVGGARRSQHLLGRAADLQPGVVTVAQAKWAGFRGIGVCNGWVVHVDIRTGRRVTFSDC